jgi:hypothetical protein
LHGCCMVVAWKNSTPVRRVSSEPSYAVVPGLVGCPCVGLDAESAPGARVARTFASSSASGTQPSVYGHWYYITAIWSVYDCRRSGRYTPIDVHLLVSVEGSERRTRTHFSTNTRTHIRAPPPPPRPNPQPRPRPVKPPPPPLPPPPLPPP